MARAGVLAIVVPALALAAAQLVPYGRNHTNPANGMLTAFDSRETRELAERACFDCHSNGTRWPWYASIAPMSWRIQRHVDEGREKLNFTAFEPQNAHMTEAAGEAGESITKGEMPPNDYLLAHPEARLTAAEKAALVRGLDLTFAPYVEKAERAAREGDDRDERR